MPRRKKEYPKTEWGREAEWEDIEKQAEPRRKEQEPREYRITFDKARAMLAEGKTPEEIKATLDVLPKPAFMTESGMNPKWANVKEAVEQSMVHVRKSAIADALDGKQPRW